MSKRKIILELKESNLKMNEKFLPQSFIRGENLLINTDENGMTEILYKQANVVYYMPISISEKDYVDDVEKVSKEIGDDSNTKIDSDIFLKTLALVINKEKLKDLK